MSSLLQRLRQKPDDEKKRIAVGTSAAITGLIFVMWVTVLNNGFTDLEATTPDIDASTQTASPLSAFQGNASAAYDRLKSSFSSGTSSTESPDAAESEASFPRKKASPTTTAQQDEEDWVDVQPQEQSEKGAEEDVQKQGVKTSDDGWAINSAVSNILNIRRGSSTQTQSSFNSRDYNPLHDSDWITQ